jgi:hypothetical protein
LIQAAQDTPAEGKKQSSLRDENRFLLLQQAVWVYFAGMVFIWSVFDELLKGVDSEATTD